MAKSKNNNKGFLYGLLAGGLVGSISALLFAPKPGKELRQDIASGAQQVGEKTVKLAGQVGDTTTKIAGQVGESTTRLAKQVSSGAVTIAGKAKQSTEGVIDSVRGWRKGSSEETTVLELVEEQVEEVEAAALKQEKELTTIS
ncbi:gas vesicle protein [Paenibacillus phyllosphaerae]|uniref:Gas vesicle protein n=1 Tax=Paenibacillus phyllosphaerae TaxID=274593 RepID=A0A7W5AXB7_9BACL|nr:YtxH domain-containing protein [Paenibacillus phyllosphaerae]MBB3109836.1 gas vesicle protein [Paenibacillus phyllosphaerae]